jgi:hypothetical protein
MAFSFINKLLRRYTPPTCTLELWVRRSRLRPFWKPVSAKDWQFNLRFDDPRMPEEQQITLKGDRQQLDNLYGIVEGYLQNFLQQTRDLWVAPASEKTSQKTVLEDSPLDLSAQTSTQTPAKTSAETSVLAATQPFLRSQGLLRHELHGGILTQTASSPIVTLSTTQLFDLTHALDDYHRDLPSLLHPQPSSAQQSTQWIVGGIAIALGFMGLVFGQERWQKMIAPTALNPDPKPTSSEANPYLNAVPPVPLPPTQPLPTPSLDPKLARRDPLPLPPPATSGDPLNRSQGNPLQNPGLRVLPPIPVAPPAPPLPAGANSTVGLNPISSGILNIVPLSPNKDTKVSPLQKLPLPPPLAARGENSANSANSRDSAIASRLAPNFATGATSEGTSPQEMMRARNATPPAQTKLLDTIPQVAEVRSHFQQHWQKPVDLKQSLEYRLTIKPNGSLAKIVPLGKAASIYQPQVGMPAIGEVFVSPLRQQEDQTIRLVLDLEGKVSTFLE